MSNHAEFPWMGDEERRKREAAYDGRRLCESLGDDEEQEGLVDRYTDLNPGMVGQSDAEIAHEMLKMVRRSMERYGGPCSPTRSATEAPIHRMRKTHVASGLGEGGCSGCFWPHRTAARSL